MSVKLAEGTRRTQAEKSDDHQSNDDEADDKITLSGIKTVHAILFQGPVFISSPAGMAI